MQRSTQVDSGVRHDAEFFGRPGAVMFGSRLTPLTAPVAGVVICSPILAEFPKNYRREVLLSRALAARGFAVQRFHYRGAGHSDGDSSELTFDTMVDDTCAAAAHLVQETGVAEVAFVGTRLGGLAAAAAVVGRPGTTPLALWEPVVDPSAYFGEVLRARLMRELKEGSGTGRSRQSLLDEMRATGWVDVLGYAICSALHRSLESRNLRTEIGEVAGEAVSPVLLVQFSSDEELRPEYGALVAAWQALRRVVTTEAVLNPDPWWFTNEPWRRDDMLVRSTPMLDLTTDWLASQFSTVEAVT